MGWITRDLCDTGFFVLVRTNKTNKTNKQNTIDMLYLMESGDYFKVGFTNGLKEFYGRMGLYKNHNPDYRLLKVTDGDYLDEGLFHEFFKPFHQRGEWFRKPKSGMKWVEAVFDSKHIPEIKKVTQYGGRLLKRDVEEYLKTGETELDFLKDLMVYVSKSNMKTVDWNREKINKLAEDKRMLEDICSSLYLQLESRFYTNAELSELFGGFINELNLDLPLKLTYIKKCANLKARRVGRSRNGVKVDGFDISIDPHNYERELDAVAGC